MHPRIEELAGALPKSLGLRIENSPALRWLLSPFVNRPRRVQTGTIRWFVPLYLIGGLRSPGGAARCATPARMPISKPG